FVLRTVRQVRAAYVALLSGEIVLLAMIVYFLGGVSWLGGYACIYGVIFTSAFLDLRRGLIYAAGISAAFVSLSVLEALGVVPHYLYLQQGALRYTDARYVITTDVGTVGVFFGVTLFLNWVGNQLRRERDRAVAANAELVIARTELEQINSGLEERVVERTADLESAYNNMRLLFEDNPNPMWVVDSTTLAFVEVNEAAVEHYGYSRDEFLAMTISDLYSNESGRAASITVGIRHADLSQSSGRHRLRDGRIIDVEVQAHDLDFDGRHAALLVVQDVTARKEAESATARLTAIVEATTDLVSIADATGKQLYLNQAGRRMLGVDEVEASGTKMLDRHPEWARAELEKEGLPTAARDGVWSGEIALLGADGREIPISQVTLAHKSPAGAVEFFSTVARDISERKRFESRLVHLAN